MSEESWHEYLPLWTQSCPTTWENPCDMSGNAMSEGFEAAL